MKHKLCHSEYTPTSDKTDICSHVEDLQCLNQMPTSFHPHAQGEIQLGMESFSQVGHPCHNFQNC